MRNKVIAIVAFQMLCPDCVEHSIPQARNLHSMLPSDDLAVIGLHTMFEHHEGRVRKHKMGHDLMLGAELMALMHQETVTEETASSVDDAGNQGSICSIEEGCT